MYTNKKIITAIAFYFLVVILFSCGGVIGNIQKYSFPNVTADNLKNALNNVYEKYPELRKSDTTMYGNNDSKDFYYMLVDKKEKIVFLCNVISYPEPNDQEVDLSLTSATTWGNVLELAPEMKTSEKKKFKRLFERNILPKIKEELH